MFRICDQALGFNDMKNHRFCDFMVLYKHFAYLLMCILLVTVQCFCIIHCKLLVKSVALKFIAFVNIFNKHAFLVYYCLAGTVVVNCMASRWSIQ